MPQVITQSSTSLTISSFPLPTSLLPSQILIQFHASPINPLDLIVLRGAYPVKPKHTHKDLPIPGFDGVASVIAVGSEVHKHDPSLMPGDTVVPKVYGLGTWRSHVVLSPDEVQKIPRPKNMLVGALLKLCVVPAYLLVEDLVTLKPGDWIIMNAGAGVIAQFVVQFARRKEVKVISVVRDRDGREEKKEVREALIAMGAEVVLTEAEFERNDASTAENLKGKNIVLALDSVFGESGERLMKSLMVGGNYVQLGMLGGAAGKIEVGAGDLFARRITMRAFRGSAQWAMRSDGEQRELLAWLVGLFNEGELVMPNLGLEKVAWNVENEEGGGKEVLTAVEKAQKGVLGQKKVVMVFEGQDMPKLEK